MKEKIPDIKLGKRLQAIASFVPDGAVVADIGTDHAYLPVYLIQRKSIDRAIGVEVHKGPYEAALKTVQIYGLADLIDIRFGNGLRPLKPAEVDTLIIAGMGGITILEILAGNPPVMEAVTRLILQPQGAESKVRRTLSSWGWNMVDECLIQDDDRIYNILCFSRFEGLSNTQIEQKLDSFAAELAGLTELPVKKYIHGRSEIFTDLFWQIGPLILTKKDIYLKSRINDIVAYKRKIVQEMKRTGSEKVKFQADRLKQEIEIMEVILKWLSL